MARQYRLPVVAICYDGVYTRPKGSPLELLYHRLRMQCARRLLAGSPCLFTTCRAMSESYAPRFSIPCRELYTPYGPSRGKENDLRPGFLHPPGEGRGKPGGQGPQSVPEQAGNRAPAGVPQPVQRAQGGGGRTGIPAGL